jgi:hypothetical protein
MPAVRPGRLPLQQFDAMSFPKLTFEPIVALIKGEGFPMRAVS